jgi:hypothetical protein
MQIRSVGIDLGKTTSMISLCQVGRGFPVAPLGARRLLRVHYSGIMGRQAMLRRLSPIPCKSLSFSMLQERVNSIPIA